MRRFLVSLLLLAPAIHGCSSVDPWDPGVPNIPRTDLYLANFSSEQVLAVHVMPAGSGGWGDNWLTAPVRPGNLYAYVGNVISGRFDIRMVGTVHTVEVLDFNCIGEYVAVAFPAQPTDAAAESLQGN